MISIHGFRQDGKYIENNVPPLHESKIENALISFAKFELGYGGHVTAITEDADKVTIKTETKILSKLDTTIFSGSKEEMEPLLKIAYLVSSTQKIDIKIFVDIINKTLGKNAGTPFFLVNFAPLIIGDLSVKTALLVALGAEPNTEMFEKLKKYNIEDLCAAWALNNYKIDGLENIL